MKTSHFCPLFMKGPSQPLVDPLEPGLGPVRTKNLTTNNKAKLLFFVCSCVPGRDSPKRINCVFLSNADSERLQYLRVWIEKGPPGSEREYNFTTFTPSPGCATVPLSAPHPMAQSTGTFWGKDHNSRRYEILGGLHSFGGLHSLSIGLCARILTGLVSGRQTEMG